MDEIRITSRPVRKPMGETYFILGLLLVTVLTLLAILLLSNDRGARGTRGISIFGLVVLVLPVIFAAPILWEDWFYNRGYSDRLQKYLQSPLSP